VRRALTLGGTALLLLAGGSAWLAFYPPVPQDLGGATSLDARAAHVRIPLAERDSLDGWLLRGRGRGVIVLFHGYGRAHDRAWRYAGFLGRQGYTLLTVDFRSSRAHDRRPTTLGHYEREDAEATVRWLEAQPWSRGQAIGVLGESLGGSVALLLAADHPEIAAVVADCPFLSGDRVMADTFRHWAGLPRVPAVPLVRGVARLVTGRDPGALDVRPAAAAMRDRAVFFIHAGRDDRMAPEEARELWRAAGSKDPIWLIEDAGHNEGWELHREEYERRVSAFFAEHLRGEPAGLRAERTP
jgi:uncharacterized protein